MEIYIIKGGNPFKDKVNLLLKNNSKMKIYNIIKLF